MIQINDFPTYVSAVLRTESIERSDRWQAHIPDRVYRVNHAFTGLTTELGELADALLTTGEVDWVNIQEELGDCWWYCGLCYDELYGADIPQLREPQLRRTPQMTNIRDTMFGLMGHVGGGMDVLKRRIYYNAGDDHPKSDWSLVRNYRLPGVVEDLLTLHAYCAIDVPETWTKNIEKLRKRYPEKFSTFAALNRDEDVERKVLES